LEIVLSGGCPRNKNWGAGGKTSGNTGAKYAKSANSGGQSSGTVKDRLLKFNVLEAIEGNYLG